MRFLTNILAKAGLIVDGTTQLNTIANATTDTDKFIVSDGGVIKYRTGAEVLSDIGAASPGSFVPYTGATQDVNLGEYGVFAGHVNLDTTPTGTPTSQGTIYWNDARSTASLIMNGTTQNIGQDSYFYAKNSTGSPIPKGTAVGFAGTDGASGHILIAPFIANGSQPSTYFMGVTSEAINNGSFGQVMQFGEMKGFDTSGYPAGSLLYVSSTVAGGFQTTAPLAPNNIILVAATLNSTNNGSIVVRVSIGSNINNDEGVKIVSPVTGQLLQLQAGGLWENKTLAQIFGGSASQFVKGDGSLDSTAYTPTSRTLTINGTSYDLSANRTWSVGTVTSVGVSVPTGLTVSNSPITGSGTIAIAFAAGYSIPTTASQSNWDTAYTNRITSLTTTGSSGAATLISNVLNIPQYTLSGLGGVPTSRTLTINGTSYDLSADRSWTIASGVTSVNAGSGISVNTTTGAVTVTNTGVLSVNGSTGAVTGIITTSNYNSYSPTLTGGGASGTWGINITGTAGSETLATVTNRGNVATGDIYVPASTHFRARYTSNDTYHASLNWYGLQLGNNGDNYIIAGRTATGGQLRFYVNNTSDFTSVNGTLSAVMFASGRTTFGNASDYGYMLNVAGSFFATDWIRVNGTSGFYFESYGGGWRMTDSSYIRSYNGKALSMEGASVDYVSSIYMNGGVYINTFNNRNLIVKASGSSDAGILGRGSGDQFAFQVYGSGGDYGFLNSAWGAWDIRKSIGGNLYLNNQSTYYISHDVLYTYRVYGTADMRSPIYYDLDDTGYYVDPNSNSRLNIVRSYRFENNDAVSTDSNFGIYFGNGDGTAYAIYRESGSWTHPYPDLRIAFHTGIKIGANASYNGVRFYDDYGMANQVMSVNNASDGLGANNVYVNNSLVAGSSLRAPIFYDSNDTSWYLDPNGFSNLRTVRVQALNSPNGDSVVAADSAMPAYQSSFIHTLGLGPGGNDGHILGMTWTNTSIYGAQIWVDTDPTNTMAFRSRSNAGVWTGWNTILHSSNYNSYSPTLTGGGASGTWGINITGSAGSVDFNNLTNKTGGTGTYQTSGDFRAPIFYDSNDTNYYLDPNGTSQLNFVNTYTTSSTRMYQYNWYVDVPGTYDGTYSWVRFSLGRFNDGGSSVEFAISRSINDNGNNPYGGCTSRFIINSREWHSGQENLWYFYTEHGSGNASQSPFGYYIHSIGPRDLAGGGYWMYMRLLNGVMYRMSVSADMNFNADGVGSPEYNVADPGGIPRLPLGSGVIGNNNNYNQITSSVGRFGIIYDYDDAAYYVDPNGNSKLLNLGLGNVTPDVRLSVNGDTHISSYLYMGGTAGSSGSWGVRALSSGGNWTVNANSFTFDNVGYGGTWNFTISSGNAQASSSMRAPIFYDSNDTTYYADFANTGTSIYTAGLIRSSGMIMKGSSGGGQIYPTMSNGGVSLYGGDSLTNGAYFTVTGLSYGASPGAGSAEFVIRSEASSKFAMFSYNGSTWTGRYSLWGSTGNVTIGSATTDYGVRLAVVGDFYASSTAVIGTSIGYSGYTLKVGVDSTTNGSIYAAGDIYAVGNITGANLSGTTYTPTVLTTANVTSYTTYTNNYSRVGDVVTVSGRIIITNTALGNASIELSLPVSSDFTLIEDCAGSITALGRVGNIEAGTTNNGALITVFAPAGSPFTYTYTYQYIIK